MKQLIDFLSGRLNITNKLLLEKDVILHRILLRITDGKFKREFAFKGGTCITKCYLGYFRFSEDIDFTYINQDILSSKSQKEIRRVLSKKVTEIVSLLWSISQEIGLDFKKDKSNKRYVELGGSNKFATFKLWYGSQVINREQFVKVQINFVELITEDILDKKARSLYSIIPEKEVQLLFPQYIDIVKSIPLRCYSLNEIMMEKIRAILTRRGLKSRDFIDAYMIMRHERFNINKNKDKIIRKIKFMLKYDKYVHNISLFDPKRVVLGEEEKIVLIPIDKGFKSFVDDFLGKLNTILYAVKR